MRRERSPTLSPAPLLECEPRTILLRLLHSILADFLRNQRDVAKVDVDVIVGVHAGRVTVGQHRDVLAQIFRDFIELLDQLFRFEDVRPDAVDVRGRSLHVRSGVRRQLVGRRAIGAVDGDVNGGAGRDAEVLEVERQKPHRTGNVARKLLEPRRLFQIDERELVQPEVLRDLDRPGRFMRFDFVKVAREPVTAPLFVADHLAGPQHRPQLIIEIECVDDF